MKDKKIKIAFYDAKPYDIESFNKTNKSYNFSIKYFIEHLTGDTAIFSKGYDIVCAFVNDQISAEVINILLENGIKMIALRCAGYNNVDLNSAFGKLHITRVPAYSPYAVAEHAIALLLTLNRKTHKAYNRTREGNFNINGLLGFDIHGKNIGVIGTGKIGKIFIDIMNGFGANIYAYDLHPDIEFAKKNNVNYTDLDTIYKNADIISLNCPLSKETYHLIDHDALSKMKKGVVLINTSRGGLIDTKALIHSLKSGHLGGAGLDVYEEESEYFFEDFSDKVVSDDILSRLLSFNNVLITSHQAFFTEEALKNISETTLTNIKDFFENGKLTNEICYKCSTGDCPRDKTGKCF